MTITVFIAGTPAPQGSKRLGFAGRGNGGRPIILDDSKRTKPWRSDIRSALLTPDGQPAEHFDGPVHVEMVFVMPRPKSAPKRTTPPATKKPDLDKLARAVLDAVSSAGVWRDDSQVITMQAGKRLANIDETSGLHLVIAPTAFELVRCVIAGDAA